MKTPADGWSPEERDALEGLGQELEALQARHADDPPLHLLRAARAGVLPEPLQSQLTDHLERSAWDRAMVDDLSQGEPTLDEVSRKRLFQRIEHAQPQRSRSRAWWHVAWPRGLAAAAVLLLAVAGWIWRNDAQTQVTGESPAARAGVDRRLPAPSFVLALTAPEVKLSATALRFRGEPGAAGLLNDLKPAVAAFRAGDYVTARREFARLASLYPSSVEVTFYDGVTRLFLDDLDGADESLTRAERIGDVAFAQDIAWYRAIVDERVGRRAQAQARVAAICRSAGPRATEACAAADGLKP